MEFNGYRRPDGRLTKAETSGYTKWTSIVTGPVI